MAIMPERKTLLALHARDRELLYGVLVERVDSGTGRTIRLVPISPIFDLVARGLGSHPIAINFPVSNLLDDTSSFQA